MFIGTRERFVRTDKLYKQTFEFTMGFLLGPTLASLF